MDDDTRRAEILQAEEGIRLLAAEMARAASVADAADEVTRKLGEAVEILQAAARTATEAASASKVTSESAQQALREALAEVRGQLSAASEGVGSSLKGIDEACASFRKAAEGAAQSNIDVTLRLERRLSELATSLTTTAMALQDVMAQTLDAKLSDLSSSLSDVTQAVQGLRQQVTSNHGRFIAQLRAGQRRQTVITVLAVVIAILGLAGAGIVIWHFMGERF